MISPGLDLSPSENLAVTHIVRAFRAGIPIRHFLDAAQAQYATAGWQKAVAQRAIISETLLYSPSPRPLSFSFGTRRMARFARLLLDEVDRTRDAEIDESLVNAAACSSQFQDPSEESRVHIVLDLPRTRIYEKKHVETISVVLLVSVLFSDLGLRVWEAALVLHAHLTTPSSSLRADVCGRRVLELGSGTGLSASGLAEAGAEYILLTDYCDEVLANIAQNVDFNIMEDRRETICLKKLNVYNPQQVCKTVVEECIDTVLSADMTYDPELMQAVVRTMREVVLTAGCIGFLLCTTRSTESDKVLDKELEDSGLSVELVDEECGLGFFDYMSRWDFAKVRIFRLTQEMEDV